MQPEIKGEDTFWRSLVMSEEDKRLHDPFHVWKGGYRWFRSPNVIPMEQWRRKHKIVGMAA